MRLLFTSIFNEDKATFQLVVAIPYSSLLKGPEKKTPNSFNFLKPFQTLLYIPSKHAHTYTLGHIVHQNFFGSKKFNLSSMFPQN